MKKLNLIRCLNLFIQLIYLNLAVFASTQNNKAPLMGKCQLIGNSHVLTFNNSQEKILANLVCIHGMSMCAQAYTKIGYELLNQHKIATYAVNVEGFGPIGSDTRNEKLDLHDTVKDIRKLINILYTQNPDIPIFLLGESMGASIAIAVTAQNNEHIAGIIAVAPAWKIKKLKRNLSKGILQYIIEPKVPVGFAAKGVIKQATSDPYLIEHIESDTSHRIKLSPIEAIAFLEFIHKTNINVTKISKTPVMIIQGLQDNLVKPESAATLYNDFKTKQKILIIDAKGSHLIFEEGQYNNNDIIELLNFIKGQNEIINYFKIHCLIINNEDINHKYQKILTKILKTIKPETYND